MSIELIEFWRAAAMRPTPHDGTLKISRSAFRRLFEAMETRALVAEADADQLAAALRADGAITAEHCSGALAAHDRAVALR